MAKPLDHIDTIAIVMLENRSFDHVLGWMSHESFPLKRTDIDGLHQHSSTFDWDNSDDSGNLYRPTANPDGYLPNDLPHGRVEGAHEAVKEQIDGGSMLGFMKSYFNYQPVDRSALPMHFCSPTDIPITSALAQNYTVCDKWFASIPTDTWPNRLMSLCGDTLIDDTSVVKPQKLKFLPDQGTMFDWLAAKGRSFKFYVDGQPVGDLGPPSGLFLMLSQWKHIFKNAHILDKLEADWKSNAPAPDVLYIEPFFNDFATVIGLHGACNHPPLPMAFGEVFLDSVYRALTSNRAKWERTMLIVCYDEHGGFFDHVPPPPMKYWPPTGNKWLKPQAFNTLGVRIPGIVISPLVEKASSYHGLLDHTSLLQLLVDKFGKQEDYAVFPQLQPRKDAGIQSLASVLTRTTPLDDIIQLPPLPPLPGSGKTPALSVVAQMFSAIVSEAAATKATLGL